MNDKEKQKELNSIASEVLNFLAGEKVDLSKKHFCFYNHNHYFDTEKERDEHMNICEDEPI